MIDSIKSVIISRMNNVLIGSFILSVAMMNSRGILIFIFSDNIEKIKILRDWELNLTLDVLIPLALTFLYITAIPFISSLVKKHITNRIYRKEQAAERERQLISYHRMSEVALAAAESTPEYAESIVNHRINKWIEEREETLSKLENHEEENKELLRKIDEKNIHINKLKESSIYYSSLYERATTSIANLSSVFHNLNNPSSRVTSEFNDDELKHKNWIILQITSEISRIVDTINSKPLITTDDWHPPIEGRLVSNLSGYIDRIKEPASTTETLAN
ncbi:hypothetical protein [Aeromonas caviae]|uniref:hypothetical protein n=1 Tax=Aeromonas caviae TaxID=648 RepID=UPI0012699884|nr:hypothetical protein [Aeromonas caviae]